MGNPIPETHTGVRAPSGFLRVDKAMGSEGSFSWEGERKKRRGGAGVLGQGSVSRIISNHNWAVRYYVSLYFWLRQVFGVTRTGLGLSGRAVI